MSRKKKPSKRKIILIVVLILLAGIVIGFWRLYSSFENRIWDYTGRINIVNKENLTVLSIPSESGNLVEIKLPSEVYVEVAEDYGSYRLKNVYEIGQVDGKGSVLLKQTVSNLLGVPIDAEQGELTIWDQYKIWQKKQDSAKTIKEINIEDLPVFIEDSLTDGTKIEKADPAKIDFYLREIFWEKDLKRENLAVGVFNASDTFELAENFARKIGNIGARVVETANYKNSVQNCILKSNAKAEESITFKRFQKAFACEVKTGEEIDPRFDIVFIIVRPI